MTVALNVKVGVVGSLAHTLLETVDDHVISVDNGGGAGLRDKSYGYSLELCIDINVVCGHSCGNILPALEYVELLGGRIRGQSDFAADLNKSLLELNAVRPEGYGVSVNGAGALEGSDDDKILGGHGRRYLH